jgi:hypothetical protein
MEIPVLVEPVLGKNSRFQARTGEPFLALAEGASADEAVSQVRQMIKNKISSGAKLMMVPIEDGNHPWLSIGGIFKDSPLADAWEQSMREYRDQVDRAELNDE